MDYEQKIRKLIVENEFLQLQLEDLNNIVKKKEAEIEFLADEAESAASLQSRMDGNFIEIEQLKYDHQQTLQKNLAIEILNEELEIDLVKQIKGRQKEQKALLEMDSVKVNMEIITQELNEATSFYKMEQSLKAMLAEARSIAELKETENFYLKNEVNELKELVKMLKLKRV